MAQIFISYSRSDQALAHVIMAAFEQAGLRVDSDASLSAGTLGERHRRIESAQCVVMLWSKAAAQSEFVQQEIAQAIQAWSEGRLILAALDDTPLPRGLRDLQAIPITPTASGFELGDLVERTRSVASQSLQSVPAPPPANVGDSGRVGALPPIAAPRRGRWLIASSLAFVLVGGLAGVLMLGQSRPTFDRAPSRTLEPVAPLPPPPPAPGNPAPPRGPVSAPVPTPPPAPQPPPGPLGAPEPTPQKPTSDGSKPGSSGAGDSYFELLPNFVLVLLLGAAIGAGVVWVSNRRSRRRVDDELKPTSAPSQQAPAPLPPSGGPLVFVSYSRHDGTAVEELVKHIEKAGYTVWIDRHSTGSQRYAAPIVRAIKTSKLVALMCSNHAFESDHVIREVYVAGDYKKPFIAFQLDRADFPDEVLYFVSGFPRIEIASLDLQQLRSEIERLVVV